MDRTSVARRIQLGAVRILQTKIAEASDEIMAMLQYVRACCIYVISASPEAEAAVEHPYVVCRFCIV